MSQLRVLQPVGMPDVNINNENTVQHPIPFMVDTHVMETGVSDHNHINLSYLFATSELPASPVGEGESVDVRFLTLPVLYGMSDDEVLVAMKKTGIYAFNLYHSNLWG